MTEFEPGGVYLARFYFSNQTDYKIRPTVVVSNAPFNHSHASVWACPFTTQDSLTEYLLPVPAAEFSGHLEKECGIRTDFLATVEKGLFLKEIGSLSPRLLEKLRTRIVQNL
jgi:mRNA-degrading endonuclease toxin of MazEF toxin-antitoxin module